MIYEALLNDKELVQMIILQESLNKAYSGEDWKRTVEFGWIESAILAEYAEFLDEVQSDWCWYKPKSEIDRNKALFELVDVVHFMLMAILYNRTIDELIPIIKSDISKSFKRDTIDDKFKALAKHLSSFLDSVSMEWNTQGIICIRNLIEVGGEMLGIDEGVFFEAYKMKNLRNRERIEGGVLQGTYDKSKEVPLQIL